MKANLNMNFTVSETRNFKKVSMVGLIAILRAASEHVKGEDLILEYNYATELHKTESGLTALEVINGAVKSKLLHIDKQGRYSVRNKQILKAIKAP